MHPPSTSTDYPVFNSQFTDADVDALAAALSLDHVKSIAAEKCSAHVIYYLVDRVFYAAERGLRRSDASQSSPRRSSDAIQARRQFATFVSDLFRRAEVTMSVVLGTLVYVERVVPFLSIAIMKWAEHRVLLGALIVASKYLNDASLKNVHWATCSGLFGRNDIARIEREFLVVLDFELAVRDEHLRRVCARMVCAGAIRMPKPYAAVKAAKTSHEIVATTMQQQKLPGVAAPVAMGGPIAEPAKSASLETIRAIWKEKERQKRMYAGSGNGEPTATTSMNTARPRPEKRHSDTEMDMDLDSHQAARRQRRRQEKAGVYLPSVPRASAPVPVARSHVPATSPTSDDDSSSSCSSCASSALSAAGSRFPSPVSPASSPDGNSPYTPLSAYHKSAQYTSYPQQQYGNLKQLQLLERFPRVPMPPMPVPTPTSASATATVPHHQRTRSIYAPHSQAPPALPTLPPFPALPLSFDDHAYTLLESSRPSSTVAYNLYPPSYRSATMAA